jgi:hypothetical protein
VTSIYTLRDAELERTFGNPTESYVQESIYRTIRDRQENPTSALAVVEYLEIARDLTRNEAVEEVFYAWQHDEAIFGSIEHESRHSHHLRLGLHLVHYLRIRRREWFWKRYNQNQLVAPFVFHGTTTVRKALSQFEDEPPEALELIAHMLVQGVDSFEIAIHAFLCALDENAIFGVPCHAYFDWDCNCQKYDEPGWDCGHQIYPQVYFVSPDWRP